jgi:hypothetical protein
MLLSFTHWLENLAFPQWIAQSSFAFPWIESIHVLCIVTVVGAIAVLDLRLLNLTSRQRSVISVSNDVLPFTWGAFVVAVITGLMLFSSKATEYAANVPFRLKMLMLACAGLNMLVFHFTSYRTVGGWNEGVDPPRRAKVAAGLSLTFWLFVIIFGRWIGFTIR